jgi:hypothetical protein
MPLDGGEPAQLTKRGGAEALESPDGRIVYYTKVAEIGPGLWSVPVEGGEEERVLESVRFGYWTIARSGIYFIDFDVPRDAARPLKFFDFQSRRVNQLGTRARSTGPTLRVLQLARMVTGCCTPASRAQTPI